MGRTIVTPKKQAIPPGFLQELNCDLMEDLWYALAAAKHPEAFEEEHSHLSLEELFDGCLADVTWADFWHAFPYELREQGDCLDEIDALGLLLSTQISRSRFERHFEQLATSSSSSSNSSGSSGASQQTTALPVRVTGSVNRSSSSSRALARAFGAAPTPRPLGDLFSGTMSALAAMPGSMSALAAMQDVEAAAAAANSRRRDGQFPLQYPLDQALQEQSWMNTVVAAAGAGAGQPRQQPVRRLSRRSLAVPPPSGQQQQQQLQARQQHVAYVSPAAPGRTTATTRTPGRTAGLYAAALGPGRTGQQQQQQQRRPPQQQQQQHPVPGTEQYTGLFDLLQQQLGAAPPSPPYVAPQSYGAYLPGSPGYQPASPPRPDTPPSPTYDPGDPFDAPSPTYAPGSPTHRGRESPGYQPYQPYSPYEFRGAESPVYQPTPGYQPAEPEFSPTSPVWQGPSSPGYAPTSPVGRPWQPLQDIQFEPFGERRSEDEGAAAAAQGPSGAGATPPHPSMLPDPGSPAADEPHSSSRVRSLVSTIQTVMAEPAAARESGAAEAGSAAPAAAAAAAAAGASMPPPRTNTGTVHTLGRVSAAAAAAAVPYRASESAAAAAAAGAGAFPPSSRLRAWRGMLDAGAVVPGMGPMAGPPLFRAPPAAAAAAAAAPAAAAGGPAGQGVSDAVAAAAAARLPADPFPEGFARAMLSLARSYAPSPGTLAAAEAAIASAAAAATAAAGAGSAGTSSRQPAAATAAAAQPAGGGQRLTGNRRTWQEACDPEGFEQERQQQQQQQARANAGDQAGPATGAGSSAAGAVADAAAGAGAAGAGTSAGQVGADGSSSGDAAGAGSSSGSRQRVNYSKVWRAVHEWLTGEDEDLLELVSQVVPYSLAGRSLKAQEDTLLQLRALASSRVVPQKVVTAVADRLYQPCPSGEAHLVRLTASSGFSKRAAAAAAVLDCCERHGMLPFYIPLAGLCTADAVEAAVMQGLFGAQQQVQPQPTVQQQQQQESAGASADAAGAPAAAAGGSAAGEAAAAAAAAAQAALAALGRLPGDLTLADMGAMVALLDSNEAAFLAGSAPPPPAAAGTPPGQLRGLDLGNLGFLASLGGAAAAAGGLGFPLGPLAAAAAAAGGGGPRSISGTPGSRGGGEDGDQLAAHLTLLGRCHSRQPMLLWLDEVDAAMTPEDGRPLREVLMQLLYRLPQAVVVMTSSSGLEAWRDAAVLRQVGEPLVQELTDGKLVLVEHRLPKSHLHPRCYDYIL